MGWDGQISLAKAFHIRHLLNALNKGNIAIFPLKDYEEYCFLLHKRFKIS